MEKLWFRRKTYGWGWTPATWQGWAVTLVAIGAVLYLSFQPDMQEPASMSALLPHFAPIILIVGILIFITYKTGETPRWQWGNPKKKK